MAGGNTRKLRKSGQVLDVRSDGAVKMFEKAIVKGPLTVVYVNAKWCGACHRFNDEVWSKLTKLKNKSVNLASVDSEFIGKTSLANVPRKFYPTLLLVGKDGKPATFKDEEGMPTNAMPRSPTLSQDMESLSKLVQTPTMKSNSPVRFDSMPRAGTSTNELSKVSVNSLAKSPFENTSLKSVNSIQKNNRGSMKINTSKPPDVGADLVASQVMSLPPTAELVPSAIKGGGLLDAIKRKTASMKAMLRMRSHATRRDRR